MNQTVQPKVDLRAVLNRAGSLTWLMKVVSHQIIGHLPQPHRLNQRLQDWRGAFNESNLWQAFEWQANHLRRLNGRFPLTDRTVLEVGPGPFARAAVAFHLMGARRVYAVDHLPLMRGEWISRYVNVLRRESERCAQLLGVPAEQVEQRLAALSGLQTREQFFQHLDMTYMAPADAASTGLPDGSIDLIFSYGVIEHIPLDDLHRLMRETRRILSPDGRAYHNIGLHDHFCGWGVDNAVDFLRYSDFKWQLIAGNALAYHNRLREPEYFDLFEQCGLMPIWHETTLMERDLEALKSLHIDKKFAGYSAEQNAASELFVDLVRATPDSSGASDLSLDALS